MDKRQDVTGQRWKAIPVTDAVVKRAAHHAKVAKLLASRNAKTGDVMVSLHWENPNDLDLHVIDPSGEKIWYQNKSSKSGGVLDHDMNVNYDTKNNNSTEHIYWPAGKAPKGKYKIIVNHFKNHGKADCQDPTPYTVFLTINGVTRTYQSVLAFNDSKKGMKQVVYEFNVP